MRTLLPNGAAFYRPNGFGGRLPAFAPPGQPAVLVGIQRDVAPPLPFGGGWLQRMRIIVVDPGQQTDFLDIEAGDPDDDSLAEVLPHWAPPRERPAPPQSPPRAVLGEILRGENGALYERFGNRIRQLKRLAAGPHGEILEIADAGEGVPRLHARVPAPSAPIETEPADREQSPSHCPPASTEPGSAGSANSSAGAGAGTPEAGFRPLFPEPGQWRVVRFGDFKLQLTSQLAHPERLRDAHRLPCYVQVFEITRPQRMDALATDLFGEASAAPELGLLTPAMVQQLQLAPVLSAPVRSPPPAARRSGLLLPRDRVFCLELAQDPTDDPATEPSTTQAATASLGAGHPPVREAASHSPPNAVPSHPRSPTPSPAPGQSVMDVPLAAVAPLPPPSSVATAAPAPTTSALVAAAAAAHPKTTIPTAFLKLWEFQISREEALFDLLRARSLWGRLRAGLGRLAGAWRNRHAWRAWQAQLSGKDLDEQLWAVRPPPGGLRHPFIRAWAERTLEAAGYNPRSMLMEWEIFWRRKAV